MQLAGHKESREGIMRNNLLLSLPICALLIWSTADAQGSRTNNHSRTQSAHNKQTKQKRPVRARTLAVRPQVPAIGASSRNVATVASAAPSASPPAPSPDRVVTEPVAIERRTVPPPPANLMSGRNATLTNRENAGMAIARSYANNRIMPTRGEEGVVVFPFGETMPSIVCAPLIVCDITLQAGEVVNDINVGDSVRWRLTPATSGSGMGTITHVIVKPTDAALQTNAIITTDRRTYVLKLVSRRTDYMARISFTYADDTQEQWRNYRANIGVQNNVNSADQPLSFNYNISGARPRWRPIRVYNDNSKTYIEFPEAIATSEAPALLVLGDGNQEQLVNYRVLGTRYVVDKLFDRAELISGTGSHQTKVTITRRD